MPDQSSGNVSNHILLSLPPAELAALWPHLKPVTLTAKDKLEIPGQPIRYIYFIESGIASVVATIRGRNMTEVAMIGREGATGSELLLGDEQAEFETLIQLSGTALRIAVDDFHRTAAAMPTLRTLMLRNARALWAQACFALLANTHGSIEARLARRLLMMHDRWGEDRIDITHEFLAFLLGVRRPGITVALHILEGQGWVRSTRGHITIQNREGLISAAKGTYIAGKPTSVS